MAGRSSRYPTELELEILKILWRDGDSTVSHVRKALTPFRDLAHTSVMTMMKIMTEKGYLQRYKKTGKRYYYKALVSEQETTQRMLGDVVARLYEGSVMSAMVNLLEIGEIKEDELNELVQIIQQKEKECEP
jgi:predicted transcriptional regulator